MKEVLFSFLSNSADLLADGRLIAIGAGIDGFVASQLPAMIPLSFVAKMTFGLDEISHPHTVAVDHTNPDGTREKMSETIPLAVRSDPRDLPDDDAKALLIAGITLNVTLAGRHKFHLLVDGEEKATRSVNIHLTS